MRYLVAVLLVSYILLTYFFLCNKTTSAAEPPKTKIEAPKASKSEVPKAKPLAFTGLSLAAGELNLKTSQPVKYAVGDLKPVFGQEVEGFLKEASTYLGSHAKKRLHIVSNYTEAEGISTVSADAGIARAEKLKLRISELTGLDPSLIIVESRKVSAHTVINDTIGGSIGFKIMDAVKTDAERLAEVEKRLRANNQVVRFEYAKSEIVITQQLKDYLSDLKYYLANKQDGRASVLGHTDHSGSNLTNARLSKRRAEAVKEILIQNGIPAGQLEAKGMGEAYPIASNKTEEGQEQNRRVEIKLK